MKIVASAFSRTSRIYENARHALLALHDIEFPPAGRLIKTSSRLFQMLDRADPIQAEVLRRLWVIRSSVLFTIVPFDSPELGLSAQLNELVQLSEGLPETRALVQSLKECVTEVLDAARNPKRDWVINMTSQAMEESDYQVGILSALAAGRVPGWPRDATHLLTDFDSRILAIGSRKHLRSNLFSRVILPCACGNVPEALLSDLIFGCVSARFDVLLYSNERFHAPKRLMLPCSNIFESHLQNTEIEREVIKVQGDPVLSAIDTWVNDAFWEGIHGASRSGSHGLSAARYMLSLDGAGVFLPENGRVTTLPADGKLTDEKDLCTVRVEELAEG